MSISCYTLLSNWTDQNFDISISIPLKQMSIYVTSFACYQINTAKTDLLNGQNNLVIHDASLQQKDFCYM